MGKLQHEALPALKLKGETWLTEMVIDWNGGYSLSHGLSATHGGSHPLQVLLIWMEFM